MIAFTIAIEIPTASVACRFAFSFRNVGDGVVHESSSTQWYFWFSLSRRSRLGNIEKSNYCSPVPLQTCLCLLLVTMNNDPLGVCVISSHFEF